MPEAIITEAVKICPLFIMALRQKFTALIINQPAALSMKIAW